MYADRLKLYEELEKTRKTTVVTYVTGDRRELETQIHAEVLDYFVHHLDLVGPTQKISLFLHTRGGDTLAAWSIANLLRQFCDILEIIVPAKAHSAGTLICLGADNIIMTKQATLGPIDPSVNGPLNPQMPGAAGPAQAARIPVSVEAINGFVEFVTKALPEASPQSIAQVLQVLAQQVHPLVLGNAYRSRNQIRMLARRLVARQLKDEAKVERVLSFLCSESGSHDYTIYRREAKDELGLNIERPDQAGYELIKKLYDDIAAELELRQPLDRNVLLAAAPTAKYAFRRGLIESRAGGSDVYVSKGTMARVQVPIGPGMMQEAFQDTRTFEGWTHESAE